MRRLSLALARLTSRLLVALHRLSVGLNLALHRFAERLRMVWKELRVVLYDVAFRLGLLAVDLGKIGLYLLPGLAALVGGLAAGSWVWATFGGLYCVGMIAAAVRFLPDDGRADGDAFDVYWASFFPPSWQDRPGVRDALRPVVEAYVRAEAALDAARHRTPRRDRVRGLLDDLRRQMRMRMHWVRRRAAPSVRRGVGVSALSPLRDTTSLLSTLEHTVRGLDAALRPAAFDASDPRADAPDGLGDTLRALQDVLRSLQELPA